MEYRPLGRAGLKLSVLSLGSWISFGGSMGVDAAAECMQVAYDAGMNFFDNAEVYGKGESERVMGAALKKLGWRRGSYTVSTKIYWGLHEGVNEQNTLNRKRLLEATTGCLERLDMDYVDLLFCHRDDLDTPIEEIVLTMHEIVQSGRAMYWGTSEWSAARIAEACDFAHRYGLHAPRMEQPQYSMVVRDVFEKQLTPVFERYGYGSTTWSPLASGVLSGKYDDGIPAGSRLDQEAWLRGALTPERITKTKAVKAVADDLGCTRSQLAIAWCAVNPAVTTVITGASRIEQLRENLGALDIMPKLTPDVMARIDEILA